MKLSNANSRWKWRRLWWKIDIWHKLGNYWFIEKFELNPIKPKLVYWFKFYMITVKYVITKWNGPNSHREAFWWRHFLINFKFKRALIRILKLFIIIIRFRYKITIFMSIFSFFFLISFFFISNWNLKASPCKYLIILALASFLKSLDYIDQFGSNNANGSKSNPYPNISTAIKQNQDNFFELSLILVSNPTPYNFSKNDLWLKYKNKNENILKIQNDEK